GRVQRARPERRHPWTSAGSPGSGAPRHPPHRRPPPRGRRTPPPATTTPPRRASIGNAALRIKETGSRPAGDVREPCEDGERLERGQPVRVERGELATELLVAAAEERELRRMCVGLTCRGSIPVLETGEERPRPRDHRLRDAGEPRHLDAVAPRRRARHDLTEEHD